MLSEIAPILGAPYQVAYAALLTSPQGDPLVAILLS